VGAVGGGREGRGAGSPRARPGGGGGAVERGGGGTEKGMEWADGASHNDQGEGRGGSGDEESEEDAINNEMKALLSTDNKVLALRMYCMSERDREQSKRGT